MVRFRSRKEKRCKESDNKTGAVKGSRTDAMVIFPESLAYNISRVALPFSDQGYFGLN
jgi:hypothetical protein